MTPTDLTRRDFVATTGAALGAMIVPRHVLGGQGYRAPSDTLNIAIVGAGGMGMSNMSQLLGERIAAVCDVDFGYVERSLANRLRPPQGQSTPRPEAVKLQEAYGKAARYTDFREMLARERDLDAVLVATPDHLHATIAHAAMRAGKHVYVQKPLTFSVYEARLLARTAKETGVTTQMGNQGHSMEGTRRVVELARSGVVGPIREAHIWTDRPVRYWAQGIPRPAPVRPSTPSPNGIARQWNVRTVDDAVLSAMATDPQTPPTGMDWNLFLGPAQPVPYHPVYHPFSWRGWVDFGTGALGDMGAHLMDQAFWALDLGYPSTVSASGSPWGGGSDRPASYPLATTAEYEFPARGQLPPVKLYWYDSGLMPPRPPFLPDDVTLPRGDGGGGVLVGERGIITYETYGNNPTVYPEPVARAAAEVPQSLPRVTTSHEMNWVQACKGEAEASAPFEYSARLTETMLLGVAALRAGPGRLLRYDAESMQFTNAPDANAFLTRDYQAGWIL